MQQLQAAGQGLSQGAEYSGDFLKQRLGNFLELAALGAAAHGGNLGGEIQRLALGRQNPEVQAGLINSPFLSGTYFAGGGRDRNNPQAVDLGGGLGPSAPNPTYPFVPNLPHGPGLDINSIMAMMQNGQAGGQLRPTYKFDKHGQPSLSLTERSQTGQNVPVFDTYEGAGGAEVGTTPTGQTIIKLQNGKFLLRNPPPIIQTEFGATSQPVGPLQRPVIQRLPKFTPRTPSTNLGFTPVTDPNTGVTQNIPTANVPPKDLADKVATGELLIRQFEQLRQPYRNPVTGVTEGRPIDQQDIFGRGTAIISELPGGGSIQRGAQRMKANLGGANAGALSYLLSITGEKGKVARLQNFLGNITEAEAQTILDAYFPSGSAYRSEQNVANFINKMSQAVELLKQTGDPDSAKALLLSGVNPTATTGTTIPPQQQNTAPGYNGAPARQSAPAATGTSRAVKLNNGTTLNVIVH